MDRMHKPILIISDMLGYFAFCGAAYFVWMFIISIENTNRHEFGMGLVLFTLYGIFPSLLSLGLAIWKKHILSKGLFIISTAIIPSFVLLHAVYAIV